MKYKSIFINIIAGLVFLPFVFASDEISKVTLEDAYRAALKKTEVLPIEESQKRQMDARIEQVDANFYPNFSAKLNYLLQGGDTKPTDQATLGISVIQPIYQGGRYQNAFSIAKSEKLSKEFALTSLRIETYSKVAYYFYSILSAQQDIKNLDTTVLQTKEIIGELQKRESIGKTKKSEVLMAQSQLVILQSELKAVEGKLIIAREQFAFVTGLNHNTTINNTETFPELKNFEYYLEIVKKRPDVEVLNTNLIIAGENVNKEKAGHLPSLNLIGDGYPLRTGSMSGVNWDIGLALTFTIFEGGNIGARVKEAIDKEKEAELLLSRKNRQVETEVRIAYQNLINLREQIKTLELALVITEKNYHEQKKDYSFSLVTNLDVLQALNSFQSTKRSLDRIRIEVMYAWANLMVSIGQIP
ncbi:MAG: TolC family protein [Candidatus Firestonebacteria bacterium]